MHYSEEQQSFSFECRCSGSFCITEAQVSASISGCNDAEKGGTAPILGGADTFLFIPSAVGRRLRHCALQHLLALRARAVRGCGGGGGGG
eukprot:166520-Rhodomonas_salina.1